MQFSTVVNEHLVCINDLLPIEPDIIQAGNMLSEIINQGGKILICGNGGSAADSQHFAAEIVGRFEKERKALPAISLSTDTSILTAVANDYSYDDIFSRQIEGLGRPGDIVIGISTSGNSSNVLNAIRKAGTMGMKTIGLLGKDGGELKDTVDKAVVVPHDVTARIQEAHILIIHFWASLIEAKCADR